VTAGSTCTANATGILVFQSDDVRVENNSVATNQVGIYAGGLNGHVESSNVSNSLVLFGIDLAGSNNVAKGNDVCNSGQAAILIEGNDNNVQGNELTEAPVGILKVSGRVGNTHTSNSFFDLLTTVQDPVLTHSIHVGPKQ